MRRAGSVVGVLAILALVGVPPVLAMDPSAVRIGGAELLFNEATNSGGSEGGTWRVDVPVVDLSESRFATRLELQLPSAGADLEPGPIVLFWGLLLSSIDTAGERDTLTWLAIPIGESVVRPTCTADGACAASFELSADLAAVQAAAASETELSVAVAFTAVRAFGDGRRAQVLPPHIAVDDDGGTLGAPDSTYGIFFLHDTFDLGRATPAEVPGTEPGRGADAPFDYAAAVRRILADPATATLTPDPRLAVHPWTPPPDQPGLAIGFEIDFLAPCPAGRLLAVLDQDGQTLHAATLDGLTRYAQVVRVPDSTFWQYGLAKPDGERLNWAQFDPESIGRGDSVRAVGTLDCVDGKGALEIGGSLPAEPIPDPGATPAAAASATVTPAASPGAVGGPLGGGSGLLPAVLAVLLVVGLLVGGRYLSRRSRAERTS